MNYRVEFHLWTNNVQKVDAVIRALSDEYSRKIIGATVLEAKSPEQISEEQNIPVSTCYRRIHELVYLSIIHIYRIDLAKGKKSVLYKSTYKNIQIKFEKNELTVDLTPNTTSPSEKLADMWSSIREVDPTKPEIVSCECDLCQESDVPCKVFFTGDSRSQLFVCAKCERKMAERSTIRDIERVVEARSAVAKPLN